MIRHLIGKQVLITNEANQFVLRGTLTTLAHSDQLCVEGSHPDHALFYDYEVAFFDPDGITPIISLH